MQHKDLPSHGVISKLPMDIAPEMKLIKAGVRDVKAKRHAVFRLNPNPDRGVGIYEGSPA
jgi:hypothetical protein